LLHRKITNIVIRNEVALDKIHADNKQMKLDILAEIDGKEKINVEIQNENEYNVIDRSQAYSSGIMYDSLKMGEDYNKLPKTVVIFIMGFNIFDSGTYHEICHLTRDLTKEVVSEKLEYHYIQLPRFLEEVSVIKNPEEQWLAYLSCQLNNEEKEELFRMNGKIENVDEIVKIVMENEDVSEAIRQAVMDKNLEMLKKQFAYEKGMKKGIEEGMTKGIAKGMTKGIEKGITKGEETSKRKMAKKM
jgi:predicted transposase/invertase (TIGR01784 family)